MILNKDTAVLHTLIEGGLYSNKMHQGSKVLLILLPFRDKWGLTKKCLESLYKQNLTGLTLKICLIDNGSDEAETAQGIKTFISDQSRKEIECFTIYIDDPFNFSQLNNCGFKSVEYNSFDYVMMVNNDIELQDENSLKKMSSVLAENKCVGNVGCTLVYPNRLIQHLFVFPGSKIVGSHPFRGSRLNSKELWFKEIRRVPAVTGAVMLMKKDVFCTVGMFDEKLPNCYQDVDLCLKVQQAGWDNVVIPDVIMTHHETQTRKAVPHWSEVEYMYNKWGDLLLWNPLISRHLSRWSEKLILDSSKQKEYPWRKFVE